MTQAANRPCRLTAEEREQVLALLPRLSGQALLAAREECAGSREVLRMIEDEMARRMDE